MTCQTCFGDVPPPPYPSAIAPVPFSYLRGLGDTASNRDYTPDVVGGLAAFAVPLAYSRYRKPKWPKATLLTQLVMVGGTYFAVRWAFNQAYKNSGSGLGAAIAWT